MAIHPILQPGIIHLFEKEPIVITGTIEENSPMGTNCLLPKTTWA